MTTSSSMRVNARFLIQTSPCGKHHSDAPQFARPERDEPHITRPLCPKHKGSESLPIVAEPDVAGTSSCLSMLESGPARNFPTREVPDLTNTPDPSGTARRSIQDRTPLRTSSGLGSRTVQLVHGPICREVLTDRRASWLGAGRGLLRCRLPDFALERQPGSASNCRCCRRPADRRGNASRGRRRPLALTLTDPPAKGGDESPQPATPTKNTTHFCESPHKGVE